MAATDDDPDATAQLADTLASQSPNTTTPPARAGIATVISRFEVKSKLGEGGMGVVMLASDPLLGRRVALKLLHAGTHASDDQQRRFLREAQAMAKLAHDNVIVVHEAGTHDGQVFVAMEYVAGKTLARWQANRGWREIVEQYVRAGRGLEAAHAAGLVHRDFKPENVLVGDDGRVRVTDFGLAAAIDVVPQRDLSQTAESLRDNLELGSLTNTGALIGTPRYMSPEQHLGEPADARADQFAFCVALYEALYREPPFVGETYPQLASRVLAGVVTPPTETDVPAAIRDVVLRGLRRAREDRFASMDELLAALSRPPVATPPPRPRRRWLIPVVVVLPLLAMTIVVWRMREDAASARDRADALESELVGLKSRLEPAPDDTPNRSPGDPVLAKAQAKFDAAQTAYLTGRYDEAVVLFMEAYNLKQFPQFLYNTAAAYHMKGKRAGDTAAYRNAVELYRRYLKEDPQAADRTKVERSIEVIERAIAAP